MAINYVNHVTIWKTDGNSKNMGYVLIKMLTVMIGGNIGDYFLPKRLKI